MKHLTSDEFIDAMEGMLDAARQGHLDTCESCGRELADLASVLREARAVRVPDPSPLFWQHFSERVRNAVGAEALPSRAWPEWLRWPVLVPLGAFALVVLTLVLSVPRQIEPTVSPAATDRVDDQVARADDSWVLVSDLVGEIDWETANAAGVVVEPGDVEMAVFDLSSEELRELTRLLRVELQRAKS